MNWVWVIVIIAAWILAQAFIIALVHGAENIRRAEQHQQTHDRIQT